MQGKLIDATEVHPGMEVRKNGRYYPVRIVEGHLQDVFRYVTGSRRLIVPRDGQVTARSAISREGQCPR